MPTLKVTHIIEEFFMFKSIFGFNCLSGEGQPWLIGPNWAVNEIGEGEYDIYRIGVDGDETRRRATTMEAKRFIRDRPSIPTVVEQREYNTRLRLIFPE